MSNKYQIFMKTKNLFHILLGTALISFGIFSCQKDEVKSPEVQTTEDDAIADELYDNVFTEVEDATASMEDAIYGGIQKSSVVETCKTITVDIPGDTVTWPKTITVNFGNGCAGLNSRIRKGKIIIVVSSRITSPYYSRTITFENFYIDGFKVEGSKTIAKNGKTDNGNPLFTIVLTNGKITSPEGKTVTREFNHSREWVTGYNTPRNRWDDEYMITGTASGTDRNGVAYTRLIVLPLDVKHPHLCPWIVSGSIKITKTDKPEVVLDYGNDLCDRIATITIGDKTSTIQLHR